MKFYTSTTQTDPLLVSGGNRVLLLYLWNKKRLMEVKGVITGAYRVNLILIAPAFHVLLHIKAELSVHDFPFLSSHRHMKGRAVVPELTPGGVMVQDFPSVSTPGGGRWR